MTLHPLLQTIVDAAALNPPPPMSAISLEDARAFTMGWAEQMGQLSGASPVARSDDVQVATRDGRLQARLHIPFGEPTALIVYLHGGGWVLGGIDSYDLVAQTIAAEMQCAVLLLDYRLAPESPFPAAVHDSYDALVWAGENCVSLLGLALPLVAMGDSAGGNLAAVSALLARDSGTPSLAAQILVYPPTDCLQTTESYKEFWESPLMAGQAMEWYWGHYLADPQERTQPFASPLRAESLAGVAPAIVVTAEHDPLRDEGEAYAERLRAEGVPVMAYRLEGLAHGVLGMIGLFDVPKQVMRRMGGELRALLAQA